METKENKKNWILSGVILVLFVVTQYMLRTKMFIYSDDVVAQERMLTMDHLEYIKYMFTSVNGKWFTDPLVHLWDNGHLRYRWQWMWYYIPLESGWLRILFQQQVKHVGGTTIKP